MNTTPSEQDRHAHYAKGRDFRPLTDDAEKGAPKPAAMAGVAVVVTNGHGQVLLGWNPSRAVWELPAGYAKGL
ncbi:hypothetical protein ABT084_20645 [Streptomyces sp. NPDC002138]|uniref:hypothetical protein n=1 Tax=Streptomyces sp. NPDC002138 TaxID=3154410 RepID=UPI0033231B78